MKTLSLEVKRTKGNQCEVIAYQLKKATDTPVVHKNFSGHKALLAQLKKAGELPTGGGATCFVRFKGKFGGKHLLLVNAGNDLQGIDRVGYAERMRRLGSVVSQKLAAEKISKAIVHFDSFLLDKEDEYDFITLSQAMCEGLYLANYKFKKYFSKAAGAKESSSEFFICAKDAELMKDVKAGHTLAEATAEGVLLARDLGNEPSNILTPEAFAEEAKSIAKKLGLKATVYDEKKIQQEKMNLLWAVGKGSVNPPRFIVLEYKPAKAKKSLALVGKGMTFDSGGISLKPGARMEDMKHDMCGAAAVLGAMSTIAKLKLPVHVWCIIAAADNMPDANATQPGNIIASRAGKTVEINNTDAEGRLILADALDYAQDLKPDYIINAATLTGAISVALGKMCAGLMSNDDDLALTICEASAFSGERIWELPLYKEYFDDLRSEYADMRNTGDGGYGGVMRGGIFLKQYIREGVKWAHVDLANVSYDHGVVPYAPRKGASGWGVRLFVDVARLLSSDMDIVE